MFRNHFIAVLLYQNNRKGFFSPKGTWPSWSQVLGRVSSIKYEFHLMEWPLNPFRTWLVTPVAWAALLLSLS